MRKQTIVIIALALIIAAIPIANYFHSRNNKQYDVKLTVWGQVSSDEAVGQEAMFKEFERRHPGVDVSILSMGAGGMNPQKLMTAIVGKKPPDIIRQDRFTIGDWASRGTFRSLDDLIARDAKKSDGVRKEDYYAPCWNEATYKGSVFAIPSCTDNRILYYNKQLFREAGLDPNRPPQTWTELREYAVKLTKYRRDGSFQRVGFIPNFGDSWLYLYSWQNDGEFLSADGKTCTLNNKRTVEALEYMVSVYDSLKGAERLDVYQKGFQINEFDPFVMGKVAMVIKYDTGLGSLARFAPDMDFGVAPAPVPDARFRQTYPNFETAGLETPRPVSPSEYSKYPKPERGRMNGEDRYITWSGGFSWAIPQGAKHVDLAWDFIKWMNSPEANLIAGKAQKAYNLAKGRPFIPSIHANLEVNKAMLKELAPQEKKFKNGLKFALEMMSFTRYRPTTLVGQKLWDEHVGAWDEAIHHRRSGITAQQALDKHTKIVQKELNRTVEREGYTVVPNGVFIGVMAALFALIFGIIYWKIRQSNDCGSCIKSEAMAGYLFASPWIIGFVVFTLGPILASLLFSFCDYDVLHPAKWVGFSNYIGWMTEDWPRLRTSIYNVIYLSLVGIPLGTVTSLAIAMLLNTKVRGMTWYRTMYYLPTILPSVAVFVLWMWVLNPEFGIVNVGWKMTLGDWFGIRAPGWLSSPEWSKPALIFMGLWGAGGGMILWLAGLQGVPQALYEAADLDGANSLQKFWNVTLPMLTPYLFFNLIMGVIGALQTFENVYILTGGGPMDSTTVPVLMLFSNAFNYFKMGYASALAWMLFFVILILSLIQFKLAPKWVHYEDEKGK